MLEKTNIRRIDFKLFISLFLLAFLPTISDTVRIFLIGNSENTAEILSIVGQIEWFDLINETLQAFLLIPLYHLFNRFIENKEKFISLAMQLFIIIFVVYNIFNIAIYIHSQSITNYMASSSNYDVTAINTYLRLETISFSFGIISSYLYLIILVIGNYKNILLITITKIISFVLLNLFFIKAYAANGVAYVNIINNIIMIVVCMAILKRENFINLKEKLKFDFKEIFIWFKTGIASGGQVFVDNIFYVIMICKLVNELNNQGDYWVANNFIWGWLLVPIMVIGDMIKRECSKKEKVKEMFKYIYLYIIVALVWIISIPFWPSIFINIMGINDYSNIYNIVVKLLPFYFTYIMCSFFDNIFYALGKTYSILIKSLIVNIGYYGILFVLYLKNMLSIDMNFIINMFGYGMVVNLVISIILFYYQFNKKQKELIV